MVQGSKYEPSIDPMAMSAANAVEDYATAAGFRVEADETASFTFAMGDKDSLIGWSMIVAGPDLVKLEETKPGAMDQYRAVVSDLLAEKGYDKAGRSLA